MGKRKYLIDHFSPSGHYLHHLTSKARHPHIATVLKRLLSSGEPRNWQELPNHIVCKIAHLGDCANMRATCKQWKKDLDEAMHSLSPAICRAQDIVRLFPNLQALDLSACSVTVDDDSLACLAALEHLQTLDISGCARVTAAGLETLAACPSLEDITLGRDPELPPGDGETVFDSRIDDDMLKALTRGEHLTSIAIGYSCKCTREGVLALTQLTGLVELAIMGHSAVDFGVLAAGDLGQFAALPGLASLSIGVVEPAAFKALPPLTTLTTLYLHGDSWERLALTAAELHHLGTLTQLHELGLHDYELLGNLRDGGAATGFLRSLRNLDCLVIDGCWIGSGCELLILKDSTHVDQIQLRVATAELEEDLEQLGDRDTELLLSQLRALPELAATDLDLQSDAITPKLVDVVLASAPQLSSLKWAFGDASRFYDYQGGDFDCSQWACQGTLEVLEIGRSLLLAPEAFHCLAECANLRELVCGVDGTLPDCLARLTRLTSLCVSWTEGADEGMQLLAGLTRLECLHVASSDMIHDSGLVHLSSLTSLAELILHSKTLEPEVTAVGLEAIAACSRLVKLELVSSITFSADALAALSGLSGLRHLDIGTFAYIDDQLLQALRPLERLRRLWLRIPKEQLWQQRDKSIRVSLDGMVALAESHPLLSFVCFANQQMVSLPQVAIDQHVLQGLVEAHRSGSVDAASLPFWMPSDDVA